MTSSCIASHHDASNWFACVTRHQRAAKSLLRDESRATRRAVPARAGTRPATRKVRAGHRGPHPLASGSKGGRRRRGLGGDAATRHRRASSSLNVPMADGSSCRSVAACWTRYRDVPSMPVADLADQDKSRDHADPHRTYAADGQHLPLRQELPLRPRGRGSPTHGRPGR